MVDPVLFTSDILSGEKACARCIRYVAEKASHIVFRLQQARFNMQSIAYSGGTVVPGKSTANLSMLLPVQILVRLSRQSAHCHDF